MKCFQIDNVDLVLTFIFSMLCMVSVMSIRTRQLHMLHFFVSTSFQWVFIPALLLIRITHYLHPHKLYIDNNKLRQFFTHNIKKWLPFDACWPNFVANTQEFLKYSRSCFITWKISIKIPHLIIYSAIKFLVRMLIFLFYRWRKDYLFVSG